MNIPPGSPVHSPVPPLVAAPTPAPAEAPSAPTPEVKAAVPDKGSGVGVLNWLMQGLGKVVPEVPMAEAKKVEEEKAKEEEPPAPPPEIRKDSKVSGESAGVLSWITQGLEKVIPQPVTKQDSQNNMICQVREISILPPNMAEDNLCVEDLETAPEEPIIIPCEEEEAAGRGSSEAPEEPSRGITKTGSSGEAEQRSGLWELKISICPAARI
ncbi:uncharacterized protein [Pyxicephalus adspersus]|uniref:uncharacterized protein n=1 Tax=Pyxicephalus adspersus TaxID=30357 RepID=UPI003B5ADE54